MNEIPPWGRILIGILIIGVLFSLVRSLADAIGDAIRALPRSPEFPERIEVRLSTPPEESKPPRRCAMPTGQWYRVSFKEGDDIAGEVYEAWIGDRHFLWITMAVRVDRELDKMVLLGSFPDDVLRPSVEMREMRGLSSDEIEEIEAAFEEDSGEEDEPAESETD